VAAPPGGFAEGNEPAEKAGGDDAFVVDIIRPETVFGWSSFVKQKLHPDDNLSDGGCGCGGGKALSSTASAFIEKRYASCEKYWESNYFKDYEPAGEEFKVVFTCRGRKFPSRLTDPDALSAASRLVSA
jgi:hypothetical protein